MSKNDITENLISESRTLKGCLSSQWGKELIENTLEKVVSSRPSKNRPKRKVIFRGHTMLEGPSPVEVYSYRCRILDTKVDLYFAPFL